MNHHRTFNNNFILKSDISVAEPYDIQIDEAGNNITTMYQSIGETSDTKVGGFERLLNYMNENFFSKDDPAINEHHYHIVKNTTVKKHMIFTISIKNKTFNSKNNRFLNSSISIKNKM